LFCTKTHTVGALGKDLIWDTLDRLHEKGLISNPKGKAKSVAVSDEAVKLSKQLFQKYFAKAS
jgi:Domain of unknown function (DUF6429)